MNKKTHYSKQWEETVNKIRKNLWRIKDYPEYDMGVHGKITDGRKFVETNMAIVVANVGNPTYAPYLKRLRKYLKYAFEHQKPL